MFERALYPSLVFLFLFATTLAMRALSPGYWDLIPGLLSLPTLILMEILERKFPYREEWRNNFGDAAADLLHTLIAFPLVMRFSQAAASFLALRSFGVSGFAVFPPGTPLWIQFPVALLLAELCFYAIHRAAHTSSFLWNFHRIHHGSSRVYWANAGRFNPFDLWVTMTVYFLPLYLLALPNEVLVLFVAVNVITGLLEHANIRFEAGPLNYVFNTAQLHRWHHAIRLEEANHNYGKVLCVWDLAFGTWLFPKSRGVGRVGVDDGRGVVPNTLGAQVIEPFVHLGTKSPWVGEIGER